MSSIVASYDPPPTIHSALFKSPPDTVPPTDELEALQQELLLLKQRTIERARKAGEDLKTIEESMRRLKEREKGKTKAVEKVKRERGFTPLPNGDEARLSAQPPAAAAPRSRMPSAPVSSIPPSTTPSLDSRKSMSDELKKQKQQKKKRKRDEFSDAELEPQKIRKTSPLPPHTHPHPTHPHPPPPKPKAPGTSASTKLPAGPDFALPASVSLLPPRPPIASPPIPGPSRPTEVMEDFSKSKQPSQVLVSTFYTSIEPWIRPIKEEDIGFLEYNGDEVEPFVMPKLGRHYSEVWEEGDAARFGGPLPGTSAICTLSNAASSSTLPRWEPSTLMETDLLTEERGHGPLTERLVSALIPMQNATEWKGVKAAEEAMEGRPGTNGAAAAAARDKLNVADLEERVKNVMRYHGLITEVPDFSEAVDDPIATALRHAQRELRTVFETNKARKARLVDIARDRLGYQEYVELRETLDKNITTLYTKLQKKDGPKSSKKKKKAGELNGSGNGTPTGMAALPPCPASLGLGPDEENRLVVPDQLKRLVQMRRQWVDKIGGVFEEKQMQNPGRIWGLPSTSVYEGVDEEVRELLEHPPAPAPSSSSGLAPRSGPASGELDARTNKGKARARDEMEQG